jgi:hypothetical protein
MFHPYLEYCSALKMEAAYSYETSVRICLTTWLQIPKTLSLRWEPQLSQTICTSCNDANAYCPRDLNVLLLQWREAPCSPSKEVFPVLSANHKETLRHLLLMFRLKARRRPYWSIVNVLGDRWPLSIHLPNAGNTMYAYIANELLEPVSCKWGVTSSLFIGFLVIVVAVKQFAWHANSPCLYEYIGHNISQICSLDTARSGSSGWGWRRWPPYVESSCEQPPWIGPRTWDWWT